MSDRVERSLDEPADASDERTMRIGEIAERTGLTQRTLRYYEELGLLPPTDRLEGGFRLYTEVDVRRLEQIVEFKRLLGFSLQEIREMVVSESERRELRHSFHHEADPVARREHVARALEIARFQLAKLDERQAALGQLRQKVETRIRRYEAEAAALVATDANRQAD
jgi:DNA-binding transcriptional MerR regulator